MREKRAKLTMPGWKSGGTVPFDAPRSSGPAVEPAGAACPAVRAAPFAPGTLQNFAGRSSQHRDSKVEGERLVAVYCFSDVEGFVNSPEVQRMFWGRAVRPD